MKRASSKVNSNAKYTIALIFSYEELNTNVLWNSVIWNLKKTLDINYVAYAPTGFHSLFFAADEIINIPSELNSFVRYQEVSEYFPKRTKIANKIHNIYRGIVQRVILKFNPTGSILLMILRTIAADRQLKFLYSSKTFKWIKEDFKTRSRSCDPFRILSGNSRASKLNKTFLIPVQNYLRFDGRREGKKKGGLFVDHFSLNEDFKFFFWRAF